MKKLNALVGDYTAISTAAECGRKYKHSYVDNLRDPTPNVPMIGGSCLHEALHWLHTDGREEWKVNANYAAGFAANIAAEAWPEGFTTPPTHKHSYLTPGHLEIVLKNYVEDNDPDEIIPIEVDGEVLAEQATVFEWTEQGESLLVGGKPDMPGVVAGQRSMIDFKSTTGWVNDWWALKFKIGHQLRLYMAMMKHKHGLDLDAAYVKGIYMGKAAADEDAKWKNRKSSRSRLFGPYHFSDEMLRETWHWFRTWQETIETWKRLEHWPQDETSCSNYGGCEFAELCGLSPAVREATAERRFVVSEPQGLLLSGADG